jgi:hypothetical protein
VVSAGSPAHLREYCFRWYDVLLLAMCTTSSSTHVLVPHMAAVSQGSFHFAAFGEPSPFDNNVSLLHIVADY